MKYLTISLAVAAMATTATAQNATLQINPGLWENNVDIAVEVNMGGQSMTIPVQVRTDQECVTDDDTTLELSDLVEDGCTVSDVTQSGSTVTAVLSCNNEGMVMDGSLTSTIADDRNSAVTTIDATGNSPMGAATMSGTVTGTRIGGC